MDARARVRRRVAEVVPAQLGARPRGRRHAVRPGCARAADQPGMGRAAAARVVVHRPAVRSGSARVARRTRRAERSDHRRDATRSGVERHHGRGTPPVGDRAPLRGRARARAHAVGRRRCGARDRHQDDGDRARARRDHRARGRMHAHEACTGDARLAGRGGRPRRLLVPARLDRRRASAALVRSPSRAGRVRCGRARDRRSDLAVHRSLGRLAERVSPWAHDRPRLRVACRPRRGRGGGRVRDASWLDCPREGAWSRRSVRDRRVCVHAPHGRSVRRCVRVQPPVSRADARPRRGAVRGVRTTPGREDAPGRLHRIARARMRERLVAEQPRGSRPQLAAR